MDFLSIVSGLDFGNIMAVSRGLMVMKSLKKSGQKPTTRNIVALIVTATIPTTNVVSW